MQGSTANPDPVGTALHKLGQKSPNPDPTTDKRGQPTRHASNNSSLTKKTNDASKPTFINNRRLHYTEKTINRRVIKPPRHYKPRHFCATFLLQILLINFLSHTAVEFTLDPTKSIYTE